MSTTTRRATASRRAEISGLATGAALDDAASANPARPTATIVLATHARPDFLDECVESIVAAMGPGDELIVRACCNPDARAKLARFGDAVRLDVAPHESKCTKLNAVIRVARHPVVVVTDDDCRVPARWVDGLVAPFADPAVGVTFGPVEGLSLVPSPTRVPTTGVPPGPAPPELWNYAHGASMSVRRAAIIDIGGFDERLGAGAAARGGEEADVVLRLAANGWTCAVAPAPVVRHLDWRDEAEHARNLLGYQRGSGAYLGAGLRRSPARTAKTLLLRAAHERGLWRERRARGVTFGPRMTLAFAGGILRGLALAPRRYLDPPNTAPMAADRASLLWVTDEPPDRNGGGGNIRQAMLLDSLAERFAITLLVVGQLSDDATRARLAGVIELRAPALRREPGRSARRLRDLRHAIARKPSGVADAARTRRVVGPVLERVADDFDVVVVHHLHLAPLVARGRRAAWLLHLFDVSSERAHQEIGGAPARRQRWLLQREMSQAERSEATAMAAYDRVVVVSDGDAEVLRRRAGRSHTADRIAVVPNGVDATARIPVPLPAAPHVLFPGTLSYRPNVLGLEWFCDEVLPQVQRAVPEVRLAVVGRAPVAAVRALGERAGVELHADVPSMTTWFDWARVVVVPLHIGTGTRLKALEAMAAARPVVGTAIGLEGLGLDDGVHARIADLPAAMAEAITTLLCDDEAAMSIATAGRKLVQARFEWTAIAARMGDLLDEVVGARRG